MGSWMDGYCLLSCGNCDSVAATVSNDGTDSDDESGDSIPVSGNCTDEKSPIDDSDYTCKEQADYGKCSESWMDGYCLLSCGQCIPEANGSEGANDTNSEVGESDDTLIDLPAAASVSGEAGNETTTDEINVSESANCTDEKSPADNSDYTCKEQADYGKCSESWMDGYCLLSCGNCEPPSRVEVVAASTDSITSSNCTDEAPAPEVDCELSAKNGDCSKEFMD